MDEQDSGDTPALSALQLELLRVLWQRGQASVAEVADALAGHRPLAHTTVATLLGRLARRGIVAAERDGRQLVYRPLLSEPDVQRTMVAGIVRSLFGGSSRALLAHLVSEHEVAGDDLQQLQALLDDAEPGDD